MKGQTSSSHISIDIYSLDNFGNSLLLLDLNENFLSFMSDNYGNIGASPWEHWDATLVIPGKAKNGINTPLL